MKNDLVVEKGRHDLELAEIKNSYRQLIKEKEAQDNVIVEQRAKIQSLQESLENSEHIQMDFVKVNQELQKALEKIRQEQDEVRWQFEGKSLEDNSEYSFHLRHSRRRPSMRKMQDQIRVTEETEES